MEQSYRPAAIEAHHYARWEQADYFAARGEGQPFCIVIPPPNVTGTLHMGHAFQTTIMDAYTRYHRMLGDRTLWQPGTDHAGIATQMVVERLLNSEGTDRQTLGREGFLERVWAWKEQSGSTITAQLRRLAASVDWSRERFTMDPGLSDAVIEVFVRLHDEGLIYRGKRLVNWDPVLHTALSDLEVLAAEEKGNLWRFRYPVAGSNEYLVVATTRPETMLGDTAVAVHPDDERYRHLVGASVELPLTGRTIPVIADEYVDPEFGTGCVKITPAHDFNDYEVGQRHNLEMISIFDADAVLNDAAPESYRGLDRFAARKRVVADLDAAGLLDGIDEHSSMIPRGDRSGVVVEPMLTDQWYVRAEPLAKPAIEAVRSGRIRFVPQNWEKVYFQWMENIQDWCISRQLWWGHRIPAWYDEQGNVYVGRDEAEVRRRHGLGADIALQQDEDVLDTWFSSALWPFTTMGWPANTRELQEFYPTSILVTGFDIIFFWVARMVMMGLKFAGDVPFREVYIHGLIRDREGQKMSKSKGNILDPIDIVDGVDLKTLLAKRTAGMMQPHLRDRVEKATRKEFPEGIEAYGADALRFAFASIATNARDLSFDVARVEGYHRFCNKLWNATRFVLAQEKPGHSGAADRGIADRWIRSRLRAALDSVDTAYAQHRLDLVAQALYEFTWHEFCDWYLEIAKNTLQGETTRSVEKLAAWETLYDVLGAILRALHPLMPFITEELWLEVCKAQDVSSESIMLESAPRSLQYPADPAAEQDIDWLQAVISALRQMRAEMNIKPAGRITVLVNRSSPEDAARLQRHRLHLERLAGVAAIAPGSDAPAAATATVVVGELTLEVPLAGLIDVQGELERIDRQLGRIQADIDKLSGKLDNPGFTGRAPADVVARERARLDELLTEQSGLAAQRDRLAALAD